MFFAQRLSKEQKKMILQKSSMHFGPDKFYQIGRRLFRKSHCGQKMIIVEVYKKFDGCCDKHNKINTVRYSDLCVCVCEECSFVEKKINLF